jgi:hypothetical protein
MKTLKVSLGVLGTVLGLTAQAQITTTSFVSALDLANSLLSSSSGITINSASYVGANSASGFFTSTGGTLPFTSGIVLTSGSRTTVEGTNTASGTGLNNGLPGDAALTGLLPSGNTFDASVLEIRFTPTNSIVSFQYVFGSEEYNEYVNSSYNDVFGFFLNGTNVALIPGTSTPVTINNVNNGLNANYYFDNTSGARATQLDGLVGVKTGFFLYAIGIADAGDGVLDSAVFLAGGSFTDAPPPNAVPEPSTYALFGAGALVGMIVLRRRSAARRA